MYVLYIHMYTCTHVCTCLLVYIRMYVHTYVCVIMCKYIHTYVCRYVHTEHTEVVCVYTVDMCSCVYVRMYVGPV